MPGPNLLLEYLTPSQSQPEVPINDAWDKIDAAVHALALGEAGEGGGSVSVSDGTTTVAAATAIDFTSGAVVTNVGGAAHVAIAGGGGGSPLTVHDGTTSVANVTDLSFVGATVTSPSAGHAVATISGGGGGGGASGVNITPDTHPSTPTPYDDEFEVGSTIDTTGARFSGANPWTLYNNSGVWNVSMGWLQGSAGNAGAVAIQTLPAGPWTFAAKLNTPQGGNQFGLTLGNRTTGKAYTVFVYGSGAAYIQLGNLTAGWVYSFNANLVSGGAPANAGPYYVQLVYNGTTLTVNYSTTALPDTWVALATRNVASDLGAAALEIGIGLNGYAPSACDWFRRTA